MGARPTAISQSYGSLGVGCFAFPADGAFACCLMRQPVAWRVGSLRVSFCFGLHKKWLEQAAWMRRVEGGASGYVLAHVACTGAKRARWTIRKTRPRFRAGPSRMFASKTCTAGYLRGMSPIPLLVHPARLSDERADGDGFGGDLAEGWCWVLDEPPSHISLMLFSGGWASRVSWAVRLPYSSRHIRGARGAPGGCPIRRAPIS